MRLLVVSNRLPVTVEKKDGKINLKESSGGLVSGLSSYLDSLKDSSFPDKTDYVWIGWPGTDIDERDTELTRNNLLKHYKAYPVFLTKELMDNFYHGFCNNTIWPLFHYFPSYVIYDQQYWNSYQLVNEKFCEAVLKTIEPGDMLWIHDYHLMLLPAMIREKIPNIKIGFFLHIPFPTYEVFSLLPSSWRVKILEGLLGADLVGFHTYDYTQYFLRCILRILGYEQDLGKIVLNNRIIKVDTFPMGINFQKFEEGVKDPEVLKYTSEFKKTLNYEKVILSLDRLDYSKGIINRLEAYEIFLRDNPEWHERIILILRLVPSRYTVKHYRKMKKQIDEFVGRLNGKYGNINWSPISYQYQFLPFNPLVAMYSISDIILVTPLRDGMNLVSKEYLAVRTDNTGVLILSEMAGSSKELGEALIINPNNKEEIAHAISEAINLPLNEQKRKNIVMRQRIKRYDVVKWADDFIGNLTSASVDEEPQNSRLLSDKITGILLEDFQNSETRLLFLDYDGTLVPFEMDPEMAKPGDQLLKLLSELAENKKCQVVLISGRDKEILEKWFGNLNIAMVAEHGAWIKESGSSSHHWSMLKNLANNWKPKISGILETYVDRLPGSFIEEKQFSFAWHYRKADPELASLRTRELLDQLLSLTANLDLQVLPGNKVIEVRNAGITKGLAGLNWLAKKDYDFILAVGDDATDEDLFKILPEHAYSIKVRPAPSCSKYYLSNHFSVIDLLNILVQ